MPLPFIFYHAFRACARLEVIRFPGRVGRLRCHAVARERVMASASSDFLLDASLTARECDAGRAKLFDRFLVTGAIEPSCGLLSGAAAAAAATMSAPHFS